MTNMGEGLGPDHTPTAPQPAASPGGGLPWAGGDPAGDGTTWVWDLTGTSVVRDDGKRTTDSALAAGGQVFGGRVTGGTRDAQLIVIGTASSGTA